jgi:hypothetical protein
LSALRLATSWSLVALSRSRSACRLQLEQVGFEPRLQGVGPLTRHDHVRGCLQGLAKAARARDQEPQRIRLAVDRPRHGRDLLFLCLDSRLRVGDLRIELRNLVLKGGNQRLLPADLVTEDLDARRRLVDRRGEVLLSGQRVRQVSSEPSTELVVRCLIRINRRIWTGDASGRSSRRSRAWRGICRANG